MIGVSGGPDSVCLLALLRDIATTYELQLHVAHLNHALRGQASDEDAAYVSQLARRWDIPFSISREDVGGFAHQRRLNLEEAARRRRYAFFAQVADVVGAKKVAVAHTANDQAETVLMNLLRGAGVAGLAGMQSLAPLPLGKPLPLDKPLPLGKMSPTHPWIIRPLLEVTRAEVETYCQERGLSPRLDATNQSLAYTRNRIRYELLPILESYNPNIYQALTQTAALMAADAEVLAGEIEQACRAALFTGSGERVSLDIAAWKGLPLALQRGVLRRAVQMVKKDLRNIEFAHIDQAIGLLNKAQTNTSLNLPDGLTLLIRYDQAVLTISDDDPPLIQYPHLPNPALPITVTIPGFTPLPNTTWSLRTKWLSHDQVAGLNFSQAGRWQAYFDAERLEFPLILRGRQPGDYFSPYGLEGRRQRLSDFMIDHKIAADVRVHIPVLASAGGHIYWLCGWRTDHHSRVRSDTERVLWAGFEES